MTFVGVETEAQYADLRYRGPVDIRVRGLAEATLGSFELRVLGVVFRYRLCVVPVVAVGE